MDIKEFNKNTENYYLEGFQKALAREKASKTPKTVFNEAEMTGNLQTALGTGNYAGVMQSLKEIFSQMGEAGLKSTMASVANSKGVAADASLGKLWNLVVSNGAKYLNQLMQKLKELATNKQAAVKQNVGGPDSFAAEAMEGLTDKEVIEEGVVDAVGGLWPKLVFKLAANSPENVEIVLKEIMSKLDFSSIAKIKSGEKYNKVALKSAISNVISRNKDLRHMPGSWESKIVAKIMAEKIGSVEKEKEGK